MQWKLHMIGDFVLQYEYHEYLNALTLLELIFFNYNLLLVLT